jgi:hypothetical protein
MLRPISPRNTSFRIPIIAKITSNLNGIRSHEGRRGKGNEHEQNIRRPSRAR